MVKPSVGSSRDYVGEKFDSFIKFMARIVKERKNIYNIIILITNTQTHIFYIIKNLFRHFSAYERKEDD